MLLRSDPRIASAMTSDASALTLLNQLHLEIMHTPDPNVLSASLGQYTAIPAARVARRTAAAPLPSAVTNPYEQILQAQTVLRQQMAMDRLSKMMTTISNVLKKASDEAQSITNNLK
jgi:hypothetical protein